MIRIERHPPRPPSPKRALRFPLLRRTYLLPPPAPPATPADQRANLPLRSPIRSAAPAHPLRDSRALPIISSLRSSLRPSLRTRGFP